MRHKIKHRCDGCVVSLRGLLLYLPIHRLVTLSHVVPKYFPLSVLSQQLKLAAKCRNLTKITEAEMAKCMPCMAANPAGSERRKASSNERNISRHSMNDIRHSSFIPDVIVSCCAVAPPSSSFKQASKQECCNRTFAAFRRPSSVVRRCFAAFCFLLFAFFILLFVRFAVCFSAFLLFCFSALCVLLFAFLLFAFLPFCFLLFCFLHFAFLLFAFCFSAFCFLLFPQLSFSFLCSSFFFFVPFLFLFLPFLLRSLHHLFHHFISMFQCFDGLCSATAAVLPQCHSASSQSSSVVTCGSSFDIICHHLTSFDFISFVNQSINQQEAKKSARWSVLLLMLFLRNCT